MSQIPEKSFYKVNEICQYTDTQPYVLRFWESEFPQLAPHKNKVGQRVYTRRDLDLILRIKKLLHEEEYTIAGARARLDEEDGGRSPVAFLPDGEIASPVTEPGPAPRPRATLFEPAPERDRDREKEREAGKKGSAAAPSAPSHEAKRAPVVPQAVSALETPFIPAPPVTDPAHLRKEVWAERERAEALHAKLEQTRVERDAAVRDQEESQRTLEHQRETIAALQHDLEAARAKTGKLDATEAALAEMQVRSGEAARLQEALQRLEAELADTRAALETERETLVHERAAADALRGRLHAVEANVEAARQDAAQARARIEAAETEALTWRERSQRASTKVAEVAASLRRVAASTRP